MGVFVFEVMEGFDIFILEEFVIDVLKFVIIKMEFGFILFVSIVMVVVDSVSLQFLEVEMLFDVILKDDVELVKFFLEQLSDVYDLL